MASNQKPKPAESKVKDDIANLDQPERSDIEAGGPPITLEEAAAPPSTRPLVPHARTAEDIDAEKQQADLDKARAQAEADQKVRNAESEVMDLEQRLEIAKRNLSNAEVEASTSDVLAAQRPICLPQHDPTIRSARSTQEAQTMVRVMKENNPTTVKK